MKKLTGGSSSSKKKRPTTTSRRPGLGGSSTTPLSVTKHDVSVSSASLPKSWEKFAFKPDATTAKTVARELRSLRPTTAKTTLKLIADQLAERSPQDRSAMSRLIMAELMGDQARDFLKVTAATRLKHPVVVPPKDPTAQHDNVLHYLDLVPPKPKLPKPPKPSKSEPQLPQTPESEPEPPKGGPLLLNALDLHTADRRMVDLAALQHRIDDESDASSMGHLKMAVKLVNDINKGDETYSQTRRTELGLTLKDDTTQQHLVDQIGFRTARTQRNEPTGLSAQNDLATTYWRSTFHKKLPEFQQKLRTKIKIDEGDLLVNSPRVLRKIEMVLGKEVTDKLRIVPLEGKKGVSVLKGIKDLKRNDIEWDAILHELGAAPSAYQLYELMDLGKDKPPSNVKVNTRADLMDLMTSSKFSRLQEIARSTGQLAPVCAMVEHLVLGLTDELGPQIFDTLTSNALNSMSKLLDIIVENEQNPAAAMRAVDLMMDEICLVVAAAKNYHVVDYRRTMRDIMLERAPSLKDLVVTQDKVQLDSHLMSSGMDSLGTALYIAMTARDHVTVKRPDQDKVERPTPRVDYFETGMLLDRLKKGELVTPRSDVMVAALNPSSPFVEPSAKDLVEKVREAVRKRKRGDPPVALILDTTIQMAAKSTKDPTQLDYVLNGLKDLIADGSLEVFLCKSFQKYASFGTGKVSAGDMTMLSKRGNLNSAWSRAEALLQEIDLDLASHDEGQMVIHMLRHGHRDELALIDHASENAKLVDEFCWPIEADFAKGSKYVDGIPLLMRSTPTGKINDIFGRLAQVDWRDSFSFLRTSYVGNIPGPWPDGNNEKHYVRINTGHEPKETMVETFFALGHLSGSLLPDGTSDAPVNLEHVPPATLRRHLATLPEAAKKNPTVKQYQNNINASYCLYGLQAPRGRADMVPTTLDFFANSTAGVTIDTQRHLARLMLENLDSKHLIVNDPILSGPILSDPMISGPTIKEPTISEDRIKGLCNAAIVLPAWQLKPFINKLKKLKLDAMGDSDNVKLLREIVERADRAL